MEASLTQATDSNCRLSRRFAQRRHTPRIASGIDSGSSFTVQRMPGYRPKRRMPQRIFHVAFGNDTSTGKGLDMETRLQRADFMIYHNTSCLLFERLFFESPEYDGFVKKPSEIKPFAIASIII